jgi:hypothetical protein
MLFAMLVIRTVQMDVLRQARWREFTNAAIRHCRQHFPEMCAWLGEQDTPATVSAALQQAAAYGFEDARDLLKFLNLTFTFGPQFDQLPWAEEILTDPDYLPGTRIDVLTAAAIQELTPPAAEDALPDGDVEPEHAGGFDGWTPVAPAPVPPPVALLPANDPPPPPDLFRMDEHFAW